jgi:hypothetical protein
LLHHLRVTTSAIFATARIGAKSGMAAVSPELVPAIC